MSHVPQLFMTKGLPGSGKSTWATEYVARRPVGEVVRVNKDTLREMLNAGRWTAKAEKHIVAARDALVTLSLKSGKSVIVDDTNFEPVHEQRLRQLAEEAGAKFAIVDFTDVPLKTCIERDLKRPNSVGHKVIQKMYLRHLAPKWEPPTYSPMKRNAIVVDIDGTLAHMQGRSPYDYTRVSEDALDPVVHELVMEFSTNYSVIIMSGRKDSCAKDTEKWLADKGVPYDALFMRSDGDDRDDAIVKGELYEQFVEPGYNVRFVLDDRDRVVGMWRARGLKVLQVADGDF